MLGKTSADKRSIAFSIAYPLAKRLLDLVIAISALLLLAPLLLLIALVVLLDSPGPILHVQSRTGRGGRVFHLYKFRSMTSQHDHLEEHRRFAEAYIYGATHTDNAQSQPALYKPATNGSSVTRIGRWLRRSSLDELPQLINVIKGEMSLVGPRPTLDYETALYTERQRQRLAVLPGLTGWAQVHGRSSIRFDDIVAWDIEYISQQSLWLDIRILLATVPMVLSGEHAG
jgi:lipopolysaccharide/colanic/teichoic acid biosynthesis glycosyltransferase